ncbi:sensor histidine kinase [Streptomyces sp. NPDC058657]|uniref:sensor histidine kinase n=1 Tax=unclassified Streptomyces TaxID=2593676 RepID=UPI0036588DA9
MPHSQYPARLGGGAAPRGRNGRARGRPPGGAEPCAPPSQRTAPTPGGPAPTLAEPWPPPALGTDDDHTTPLASALAEDVPPPSLPIQINALQALCRQVFAFRLVMIAIGAPLALSRAQGPLGSWLVGGAVTATVVGSYAMLRDWETFAPLLIRYRSLMAVDLLFGSVLLLTASPDSSLGYATVCTPLLAGLLYGWRGAGIFAAVQILILAGAYGAWEARLAGPAGTVLISGFCVAAGVVGVTLRNLMFRFGAATQALSEVKARLAVADAVEEERARLAREMHDSVAKTLHGVALAADSLAESADRMDPLTVKHQAGVVARSARRAAAESREILSDLRRKADYEGGGVDVTAELEARVRDFTTRTGVPTDLLPADPAGEVPTPPLPHAVARPLITIATEALENSHRHAGAHRVTIELGVQKGMLRLSILDDGKGLPPGLNLEDLRRAGHFGLVGMVERAAAIGARIRIGRGHTKSGTEVRLDLPLAALNPSPSWAPGPPDPTPQPAWAAGPPDPTPLPAWAAGPPPGGEWGLPCSSEAESLGKGGQGGGPPAEPNNAPTPSPGPARPTTGTPRP